MLIGFIQLVHIIVCVGLIVIVLLQADKGEGLAGAFGGGASSTVFGERGGGGFMSKLTTGMAIVFMVTSLVLALNLPGWLEESTSTTTTQSVPRQHQQQPTAPTPPVPGLPIGLPGGQ